MKEESRTKSLGGGAGLGSGELGVGVGLSERTVRRILKVEADCAKVCRMLRNSAGRARKGCRGLVMIGCLVGELFRETGNEENGRRTEDGAEVIEICNEASVGV